MFKKSYFIKKINSPLKASIIRSFDVNKVGTPVDKLVGAIVGGTIKSGSIKIGDKIKIIPGIIKDNMSIPLTAVVETLKTENTPLDVAYPGGLIGIGLSLDPSLSKEDKLVGNFIVSENDNSYTIFKKAKISYNKYDELVELKKDEYYVMMLGSTKRDIKVTSINNSKNELCFANLSKSFISSFFKKFSILSPPI